MPGLEEIKPLKGPKQGLLSGLSYEHSVSDDYVEPLSRYN